MNPLSFFRKSAPSAPFAGDDAARMKLYRKLRFQSFIAGTVGYSLYYVCRTSLNVVKKPILESGALNATQLGVIGSALLFAYAIGKFINGFLSDHSNIKRFMAAGLTVSTIANSRRPPAAPRTTDTLCRSAARSTTAVVGRRATGSR